MMKDAWRSIVTPAYNAGRYLADTIRSVQRQTYPRWEMLIVDDCSTDETYAVACSFAEADSRIRVLRHEKNGGAAAARNTALEAAKGTYIAFLDSDDLWAPEKLEKQLAFMEANGYALTYTMYQFLLEDGRLGKVVRVPARMTEKKIYGNTSIACLTVMVNREMTGPFSMPPLKHAEDQCTWQSILRRGYEAVALEENLAFYRISASSMTHSKRNAAKKQWEVYRKYHGFSLLKSGYYFACYGANAVKKHFFDR